MKDPIILLDESVLNTTALPEVATILITVAPLTVVALPLPDANATFYPTGKILAISL